MTTLEQGGLREVKPFMYGDHIHYLDQPACTICEEQNSIFMEALRTQGGQAIQTKIDRLKSYRAYDSKYPYDSATKALSLDVVEEGMPDTILDKIIADEAVAEFKAGLTDKQLAVVEGTEEGYKPREIAEQQGLGGSGSVRWHKFVVKQKLGKLSPELKDETE